MSSRLNYQAFCGPVLRSSFFEIGFPRTQNAAQSRFVVIKLCLNRKSCRLGKKEIDTSDCPFICPRAEPISSIKPKLASAFRHCLPCCYCPPTPPSTVGPPPPRRCCLRRPYNTTIAVSHCRCRLPPQPMLPDSAAAVIAPR